MATVDSIGSTSNESDLGSLDENHFVVMNAIFLKKMATTDDIVTLTGIEGAELSAILDLSADAGLIMTTDSGHLLLPEGSAIVAQHYNKTYKAVRNSPLLNDWYSQFESLNTRFIAALTQWQQDSEDDLLFKALDIVERLCTRIDDLRPLVPRYGDYQRRFEAASNAVESGDSDLLCNPRRDSVHNIWFEFHEDILCVMGRARDTT
ncbi:MAG: hypothetical protein ACI9BW_002978 [Gammaproteobacteria bacterium]|jgi:hypothetical protein